MKNILFSWICVFMLFSCKEKVSYESFGKEISSINANNINDMADVYANMQLGELTDYKLKAQVKDVCKAKGCWMTLQLEDGNEVMVKFKDYAFFVPKNIEGKEVIVKGKAFVNEVPVEELQHYAQDAGKSEEEIAAITSPKRTLSFEAVGVLIKQ
ncbi:DUF4920 domain-containing protein [Aestuariibaculum suncheonense]|uniref:DUF4920 domain-containing protein n=1 Tax=Aestuariibaculum suncheonense TaxID=1028745 RepID=A0A8J6QEG7_9FLAO|nr:DUF4920 domain-containing protein [Aestuariibaculum suncheonense]MBD0834882.1 DUF4920 domain-containing protein [Aestuariibaculum suncheonense]